MILMHWNGSYWRARKDRKMAYITHVYDLYCEDRLIGQSKAAGQIAKLMGIPIGAVTVYAKDGTLVDGRYKIVQKKEKAKSHLAYVLEDWDKLIEPFQHVEWVKELGPGVKKLEVSE